MKRISQIQKPSATEQLADFTRFVLAQLWTFSWGILRFFTMLILNFPISPRAAKTWAFHWAAHQSPKPVLCEKCSWVGSLRFAVKRYFHDGSLIQVEECPRCGMENSLVS